jgi:nitrilase
MYNRSQHYKGGALAAAQCFVATRPERRKAVGTKFNKVNVAVVQASPVLLDREGTVEKACRLIEEAAAQGAQLVVFPEAFVPGYLWGVTMGTAIGGRTDAGRKAFARYWANSVEIPGADVAKLAAAARRARAFVTIGLIERDTTYSRGTLYCTAAYFGPEGDLLAKHRKLKPTAAERYIWGEGDGSTLPVLDTPIGRLGGLICWENYMPLARMAMYAQGVELYVAPTADTRDTWQATIRHIACEGRCFVLSCCQYSTKDLYPADFEVREELAAAPEVLARGGSAIIGPLGQYLAGPLFGEEGILYAELDFADLAGGKFDFDVVGHYARADVLRLVVNTKAHLPVEMQPTLPTTALEPEINQAGVPLEVVDASAQP